VHFVVGPADSCYGILIVKHEKTVKLEDCFMVDKKWFVLTPIGAIWSPEHDFYVV
tara:strand:+ start:4943 stop:5107 length:165 start_codon:yes stop_codon:yes gene_type:complete